MANNVKVTAARLYAELRGNNIRVTTASTYAEFKGNQASRVTRVGAYAELSGSDTKVSSSATNAYLELAGSNTQVAATSVGIYVELTPGVSSPPTNPSNAIVDTEDNVKVTELIMLAGAQLTGILMPQFFVYAEILDAQIRATKFGVLPELRGKEFHVTKFGVLIEIHYERPPDTGIIITGSYKTWRDHYPQNTTDIRPFEAYNFIVSSNGMYMIDLEWEDVDGADGYEIERSLNGTTGWSLIQVVDDDIHEYISISLDPNTTYYYRIRSFNEGGYSPYGDVVSQTTHKVGPGLIAKEQIANTTTHLIQIPRSSAIQTGDFMLMQIGVQDVDSIITPEGWATETILPAGDYSNIILSKTSASNEPYYYEIERVGSETPIVTVSLFAWDARDDNIIFFDG